MQIFFGMTASAVQKGLRRSYANHFSCIAAYRLVRRGQYGDLIEKLNHLQIQNGRNFAVRAVGSEQEYWMRYYKSNFRTN